MQRKIDFLETLRGFAALYVLMHHARWFLWEGYSTGFKQHPEAFSILDQFQVYFLSLFVFGHQMVIFFFVLSGFVIHLKYARQLQRGERRVDWPSYFKRRAMRIYPPMVFALCLTFLLDTIGRGLHFPIFGDESRFQVINNNFNGAALLGNITMVMNTYVDTWGSNFALWSLGYEWWFYLFFPAFFFLLRWRPLLAHGSMVLLFVLALVFPDWPVSLLQDIFGYMLIWWLGVLLAEVYVGRLKFSFRMLALFTLLLPFCALKYYNQVNHFIDFIWGLGFTGLLAFMFLLNERGKMPPLLNKWKHLGRFSFTLYITHFPVLVFISGWVMQPDGSLPLHFSFVWLGVVSCVILAYAAHFLIEVPFMGPAGKNDLLRPNRQKTVMQENVIR